MDTVSHGLWSFIIWHAVPFPLLAVFVGILPDLLSISPVFFYQLYKRRWRKALLCEDEGAPDGMRRYKAITFNYTHSLVIAIAGIGLVSLLWGFQWWLLAWPFHIVIDIVTHPREKAAKFLWPLFGTKVHGMKWWSRQFLALNAVLLGAAIVHYHLYRLH